MQPLEDIQREFFAAVRLPLRGASRRSTDLPPSSEPHSGEFLGTAERLMKGTANLSSAERLELYHRQYWFRLLDSVAEDFPVLQRMAGDVLFWEMLEAYLSACPSGSFTLRHLGRSMAEFVGGWERLDPLRRRWFSAVAELEYAAMEIYEAEEREPLPPDRVASETLELQPHVRLLDLPVPADRCLNWDTFPEEAALPEETPVGVAVWRGTEGQGMRARLDSREAELLRRLRSGGTLGEIFAEPLDPAPTEGEVTSWFSNWQSRGWITARGSAIIELQADADEDWSGVDKMGSQARAMDGP